MSANSARRWIRILAIIGTGLLTLVVAVLALLQLPPVATWAMRRLVTIVPLNPGYQLEVGRVSGDWLHRLTLEDVRLVRNDRELAVIDRLKAGYDLRQLRGPARRLQELTVEGGRAIAHREGQSWDLANAIRRSADTSAGSGAGFVVQRLNVRDVELAAELSADSTVRVRGLNLQARDLVLGPDVLVRVDQLNAALSPPGTGRWFALATRGRVTESEFRFDPVRIQTEQSRIAGRMVLPRDLAEPGRAEELDLRVNATPLALADLAAVVPGVTPEGDLRLEASAQGNQEGLVITSLGARLDEATLTLNGAVPIAKGASGYRLHGRIRRLDPSRLYQSAPAGNINGEIAADLVGTALRQSAGTIELRLAQSRLGGTALQGLDVHAALHGGNARFRLQGTAEGGRLALSGRIRPFDSIPEYRLAGSANDLPGTDQVARTLAGESGDPVLDLRFQLAGAGLSPNSARASGRVDLAALRNDGGRTPLGSSTIALAGGRLQARPSLLVGGGRISARVSTQLGDTLTYEVRYGTIDRVDLGRLLQDTATAPVSGTFSLSGRGSTPATARATARVQLEEVRYAARQMEQVTAVVNLSHGRARVDVEGLLQGGRLAVALDARPFDNTKTFILRRASLTGSDLGSFFGRSDLAGPVTLRISGSGSSHGSNRSLRARLQVDPSRMGRFNVSFGSLALTLKGERLTYDGSLRTNAGVVALAGEGYPLAETPRFSIRRGRTDSLNFGVLLGRANLQTALNTRFTGSMVPGSADSMQARLGIELLPSRINQAQLNSGHVETQLDRGTLRAQARLTGRDVEAEVDVSGQTGSASRLHSEGTLRIERLARWTGQPDADGRVESRFAFDIAADSSGLFSVGGTVDAIGGMGGVRLNELHVAVQPEPGAIHLDTLLLRSNVIALDGGGRVALREQAHADTLRLTGVTGDLAPLAALAGADSITLDSGRVAVTLSGPARHWRLDSKAELHRVLSGDNLAEVLAVQGGAVLDSGGVSGLAGELRVESAAIGTIRIPRARLVARYDSVFAAQATIAVGDSVRLATQLRGVAASDTLQAELQRLDLVEGDRRWSLAQPAALTLRPEIVVNGLDLRSDTRRILVNGTFDRKGPSDIALRLTNVDLDILREVKLSPIGGRLDGWLRLTGPPAAPALAGSMRLGVRRPKGGEIGRIDSDLTWNREGLRVNAAAVPQKGGRLTVNGTLPWRLTLAPADTAASVGVVRGSADTLGLVVRADSFDLGLFQPLLSPETARELRGRLVADARVSGRTGAPRAQGTVQISGAGVTLPTLDVSYRGGELAGRLAGDELTIERLRLLTGKKETLTARGVVRLRPVTDPALDLTADLNQFRISHSSTLQAVASGQLQLRGTLSRPSLIGRLTMGRTDIIVGGGQASATVEEVKLTPEDLRQVARRFGPAALARAHESPGLIDRFHLDLNLRLPRRVWFRKRTSPKADIELSGRIRLRQEPGQQMQFFGRVEPIPGRGSLDVYGREFQLIGGDITLAGPTDSTLLDVTAQYQVPTQGGPEDEDVLIEVAARGRPDSISLEFHGDPEMSQDDMLSYIVTGRPSSDNPLAEQTGEGESVGEAGAAVALSGLTQSLSNAAEEELGLDVFQIRQEGLHGMTLTAGRYVGSRVFLSLHLPIELGAEEQQAPGANLGPTFELEYVAQRWLRANVQGGNVPPRFTLRSRYAY